MKRHVATGVAANWDEAERRADENDMPSEYHLDGVPRVALVWTLLTSFFLDGRFIIENMLEPTRIIQSVDDPSFVLP